jgi:hypothetical protein
MKKISSFLAIISVFVILGGTMAYACDPTGDPLCQALRVPGTSDPWLANGTTASFNPGSGEPADFAPAQSPVLVTGITITPGIMLQWIATGQVGHPGDLAGPDGASSVMTAHFTGAENGISDITVPINALLGVFLGSSIGSPPSAMDFTAPGSRDYDSLAPALQQVFFMGDGLKGGSIAQTIVAPAGAEWLYLGTMDGFSWNNNSGEFCVTMNAVPEPLSMLLLGLGIAGLAGVRRFRK